MPTKFDPTLSPEANKILEPLYAGTTEWAQARRLEQQERDIQKDAEEFDRLHQEADTQAREEQLRLQQIAPEPEPWREQLGTDYSGVNTAQDMQDELRFKQELEMLQEQGRLAEEQEQALLENRATTEEAELQKHDLIPRDANAISLGDAIGRADELDEMAAILEAHRNTPFVRRMLEPDAYPTIPGPDGTRASHQMAYGEVGGRFYAYPTLVLQGNELVRPEDPFGEALRTGNAIEFNTEQEAADFAAGAWKDVAPEPAPQEQPKIEIQPTTNVGNIAKELKASLLPELGLEE